MNYIDVYPLYVCTWDYSNEFSSSHAKYWTFEKKTWGKNNNKRIEEDTQWYVGRKKKWRMKPFIYNESRRMLEKLLKVQAFKDEINERSLIFN